MAEPTRQVLLLVGRAGTPDESRPLPALVGRLARHAIGATLLGIEGSGGDGAGRSDRVLAPLCLGSRWGQALAVRRLGFGAERPLPDLIHVLESSAGPSGLAIAEHWGIPYVQSIEEFVGPRARIRLSKRWCRRLVAANGELAGDLAGGFGVPPSWIEVIAPGIEVQAGSLDGAFRNAKVPVIGAAGPLIASSGFATFLAAARRVIDAGVDAEFVIAGQGEDEVDLRRRAARLKIADRVTFAGPPVGSMRFWSVLDLFCETSLVPTVGRSLATAMARAVPVIASDIAGIRGLVVHGRTGLRIPPNDSAALSRTILALLEDRARARDLGGRGRQLVHDAFNADAEAAALAGLYRSTLERPPHPPQQPPGPGPASLRASTRRS